MMTPSEQWIFCLALVYSVPSFIGGIGITLLFVYWRDICHAAAMMPQFLSPEPALERRDFGGASKTPADQVHGDPANRLRLG
jgi:hypothetical protein